MLQVTAATRNRAKVSELQGLLEGAAIVRALPHDISPEMSNTAELEIGKDCLEIATAKAIFWSAALHADELLIATDGGLLVPALGSNWNPTRTRRFAGENASDSDRARTLLELTTGLNGAERQIGWIETVVIARRGEVVASWSAESEPGLLSRKIDEANLQISSGFWIDALWRYPRFGNRLRRELTSEELVARRDHWSKLRAPIRAWLFNANAESGID